MVEVLVGLVEEEPQVGRWRFLRRSSEFASGELGGRVAYHCLLSGPGQGCQLPWGRKYVDGLSEVYLYDVSYCFLVMEEPGRGR